MKIAYLINQYPQTSQSFIRREIAALEAQGVHVDRFTLRAWDQQVVDAGDIAEKEKTRIVLGVGAVGLLLAILKVLLTRPVKFFRALQMVWKLGKKGERGRLYHLIYLGEACVLLGWVRQAGSQHIHAHFGTNSTAVALLVRVLGGPTYSFTCHGPEEFDRPGALKLGMKVEHSEFAIAVSEYGKSQLFRWCGHEYWRKIHVVHCGLDESFLTGNSSEVPDVRRLVCVGRLAEQKGQLLLVEAAGRLKNLGENFEIILVGDGPMRVEIEQLIGRYQLEENVHITGWMSNKQVREQIINARAMILPSFAEGLPVVVMEALGLRRPVVSTYVAGIPELVAPGICGYLIPAGSVDALTEVIGHVLREDVARLREMGDSGARRVADNHNARTEAGKLAALFRGVAVGQDVRSEEMRLRSTLAQSSAPVGPGGG